MTQREKIYQQIEILKAEQKKLEQAQEEIMLRLSEIKIEIGECEDNLIELDMIDGI